MNLAAALAAPTQLVLPLFLDDAAVDRILATPPPDSFQTEVRRAHRRLRLPQLGFWTPPEAPKVPRRRPKLAGVVLSLKDGLAAYRASWKQERASLRGDVHPMLAAWGVATWDWSEDGRLVDGGAGPEGWAAWRGTLVEQAMARREAAVQAEMEAKGVKPKNPLQRPKRTKQQAAAAATAALMAGKPGEKLRARQAAKAASAGAKA